MTELADQILATLHRIAPDVDPSTVEPTRPLVDQLDLDSIDYQNLLAAISAEHAVSIPASDVAQLRSIDDLVHYVELHRRPA
ncbi:MAG: phosphopantetheine-binding protein [Deltaproteobacteria bacterium]|nr:phosphopantetheine-binding protein [Deltaproteobacteria bacterium]